MTMIYQTETTKRVISKQGPLAHLYMTQLDLFKYSSERDFTSHLFCCGVLHIIIVNLTFPEFGKPYLRLKARASYLIFTPAVRFPWAPNALLAINRCLYFPVLCQDLFVREIKKCTEHYLDKLGEESYDHWKTGRMYKARLTQNKEKAETPNSQSLGIHIRTNQTQKSCLCAADSQNAKDYHFCSLEEISH